MRGRVTTRWKRLPSAIAPGTISSKRYGVTKMAEDASKNYFDAFEKVYPDQGEDINVARLREVISTLPPNSGDTAEALSILNRFEKAEGPIFSNNPGWEIWIGHCFAVFADHPDYNDLYVFAATCETGSLQAAARGYEYTDEKKSIKTLLYHLERKDWASLPYFSDILNPLIAGIPGDFRERLSFPERVNGTSHLIKPKGFAKVFIRQDSEGILLVEPASSGGWYSRLYKTTP